MDLWAMDWKNGKEKNVTLLRWFTICLREQKLLSQTSSPINSLCEITARRLRLLETTERVGRLKYFYSRAVQLDRLHLSWPKTAKIEFRLDSYP